MLTVGSLFSGIGGFDLAAERAGMTVEWQVELDDYCNKVLAKHWPTVRRYRDVRDCGAANLAPVDLICGGFPCQPFSVAGKRGGADDDRYLWPEMRRVIAELKPRWVVAENVPGIINLALDTVLADLDSEGYEVGTLVLPACGVGAWHIRQRVWIVAHRNGKRCQEQRCPVPVGAEQSGAERHGHIPADTERPEWRADEQESRQAGRVPVAARLGDDGATECGAAADTDSGRSEQHECDTQRAVQQSDTFDWWAAESRVRGVPDGLRSGVDKGRVNRLKALGNAIVPQVAEVLFRYIAEVEENVHGYEPAYAR